MVTLIRVEPTQAKTTPTVAAPFSTVYPAANPGVGAPATPPSFSDAGLRPSPIVRIERKVRRSISPISGMALEKLGHAIEYLTDEYAFESAVSGSTLAGDPTLQAIQLLMSLNRQVYFECPVIEPLAQRIFSRLFPEQAQPSSR